MDGSLPETKSPAVEEVLALCTLLEEHKGGSVTALDLRSLHSWTDFFIIATVQSGAHLEGLCRHIKDYIASQKIALYRPMGKNDGEATGAGGWKTVDLGTVVIHLMTAELREFYELEELWSSAGRIFPGYSSKSS